LPDADLVRFRASQRRFVQHVERDIGQLFHNPEFTRLRGFVCALAF
jgi:hypothetical protein